MPIERQTIVDRIEIDRAGVVQVRFGKMLVEDGKEIACEWHRTAFLPGDDIDAQMARVNAHLASLGCALVADDHVQHIRNHARAAWTPTRVHAVADEFEAATQRMREAGDGLDAQASALKGAMSATFKRLAAARDARLRRKRG